MIGTAEEAKIAKSIVHTLGLDNSAQVVFDSKTRLQTVSEYDLTDYPGWRFVGVGTTRVCVLSPSNVVYKIGRWNYSTDNKNEYDSYLQMTGDLGDVWITANCRLPQCNLYDNVIAMEYISGEYPSRTVSSDIADECNRRWGLDDIFYANIRTDKQGFLVIIDFSR